jgi:hypothetical protein
MKILTIIHYTQFYYRTICVDYAGRNRSPVHFKTTDSPERKPIGIRNLHAFNDIIASAGFEPVTEQAVILQIPYAGLGQSQTMNVPHRQQTDFLFVENTCTNKVGVLQIANSVWLAMCLVSVRYYYPQLKSLCE